MKHSFLLRQSQLFTDRVANMGFKETCNSHRSLVVLPKVPSWAVDGGVGQLKLPTFSFHALKVDHQHLASRNLVRPMAEGVQDGLVVLRDWNKAVIV